MSNADSVCEQEQSVQRQQQQRRPADTKVSVDFTANTTTPESLEQPYSWEIRKQRTLATFVLLVSVATVAVYIKFARISELRNTLDEWWTKYIAEQVSPTPKQLEPILLLCARHPQLVSATFLGITWAILAMVLYVVMRDVDGKRVSKWSTLSIVVPLTFAMAFPVITTLDGFQPFSLLYIAYGLSYVLVGVSMCVWHND